MNQLLMRGSPVLRPLIQAGYAAYLVGGSVRDALMNRPIHDLDIATDALPHQVKDTFPLLRTLDTGLHHGTVTLLTPGEPIEVTTFRKEGLYSDHRRPDQVSFTSDLQEDLSRRDFTMNAIALGLDGLFDPFGGQDDIHNQLIRCVGDPDVRFTEDALRMLRALRFSSILGFAIHPDTAAAIHRCAPLLAYVSSERISSELIQLLCGNAVRQVMLSFPDIISTIIPELAPTVSFQQHTPHHSFDVYTHIIKTVEGVAPVPVLRLAALLHDVAKPETFHLDEAGIGHFYRHAKQGAPISQDILQRLKLPNATIRQIIPLVEHHGLTRDTPLPKIPKLIGRLGEETFFNLLALDMADSCAKHPTSTPEDGNWTNIEAYARAFLATDPCLTRADLSVSGDDAIAIGFRGREIGVALHHLLSQVIDGTLENDRQLLLSTLKKLHADV